MARRALNRLTHREVQTTTTAGRHGDGAGLYLHVEAPGPDGKAGAKRWVFVFQWEGKRKEMGLGSAYAVKIAEAREAVQAARKLVQAGVNPILARQAKPTPEVRTPTFGELADAYIKDQGPGWKSEVHRKQWAMTLREYAKPLRHLPIDQVTADDVAEALRPIWLKTPDTASRTRGRIEAVLSAAKARKLRTGENPAAWKENLEFLLPQQPSLVRGHHAALPFMEVPALMAELRELESVSSKALQFTILTALRTREVTDATGPELDFPAKILTIPPDRMKAGVQHRVPLTDRVMELAGEPGKGLVFPGAKAGKPLSNMAMAEMLKGLRPGYTVHGFRSSFRDWAGEMTDFPREVAEAALAHTLKDKVEAAYRRGDALEKRRKLMEAWEAFCLSGSLDHIKPRGACDAPEAPPEPPAE